MAVFQMPAFLYHLELGEGSDETLQFELTSYELASRMAYFLTGGPREKHFDLFKQWAHTHAAALFWQRSATGPHQESG